MHILSEVIRITNQVLQFIQGFLTVPFSAYTEWHMNLN